METRSKRSHITPKATTGRVGVTEDDKRFLFEPLTRYGFLPTKHLIAIDRRHHTTTRSRLKKYFQETEKWPLRNKPIIRHTDALRYSINAQAHYYRGPATFRDLNTPLQLQKWIEATTIGPRFNDHDVLLSCSIADIEIATKKAGLRFISHLEILKGASEKAQKAENPFEIPVGPIAWNFKSGRRTIAKTTLIPDAIFGIEYPEGIRFYAAEFDRGNETYIPTHSLDDTSWLRKMLCYQAIKPTINEYLGIPKLYVLAAMRTQLKAKNLLAAIAKVYPSGTDMFAVGLAKEIGAFSRISAPDDYYFTMDWQRVNNPSINLSRV